jgi:FMN phosphatase YigB (HAD superfamily)
MLISIGQVIQNTFRPLTVPDSEIPRELVRQLLNRFRSGEGYILFPDVEVLLNKFRAYAKKNNASLVVGVITNSDDRVPDILTSLGMRVGSLRFGTEPTTTEGSEINDIDFAVMSYDVGHEKPHKSIFEAAQGLVLEVLKCRDDDTGRKVDRPTWPALYIGDDYGCDVVGARNAGWKAILVDREVAAGQDHIERLNNQPSNDLFEILTKTDAVTCDSLAQLAQWVPE